MVFREIDKFKAGGVVKVDQLPNFVPDSRTTSAALYITVTDVCGQTVAISTAEIVKAIMKCGREFRLFGMDTRTIIALKYEYDKKNGPPAITPELVQEVFK